MDYRHPPPSHDSQKRVLIKLLEIDRSTRLHVGQIWYVLDRLWFLNLIKCIDEKGSKYPPINSHRIKGNKKRLRKLKSLGCILRKDLSVNHDFLIVSVRTYNRLLTWYGKEEINSAERIILLNPKNRMLELEIYPLLLTVFHIRTSDEERVDKKIRKILVSRSANIDYLRDLGHNLFKVNEEDFDSRIWMLRNKRSKCILLSTHRAILGELALSDELFLIFEYKRKDEEFWHLHNHTMQHKRESSSKKRKKIISGVCTFCHVGNSDFMNTSIFCLANCPPLTKFILSDIFPKNGPFVSNYKDVIRRIFDPKKRLWNDKSFVSALSLISVIQKDSPCFGLSNRPHDCVNFIRYFLGKMDEELSRENHHDQIDVLKQISRRKERDDENEGEEEEEDGSERTEDEKKKISIIKDLFEGQVLSTMRCKKCFRSSERINRFYVLSVPVREIKIVCIMLMNTAYDRTNFGLRPTKYQIKVTEDSTIGSIRMKMAEILNERPNSLVFGDMDSFRIAYGEHGIPDDRTKIKHLFNTQRVLCHYKLKNVKEQKFLKIMGRRVKTLSGQSIPIIMPLPIKVTASQLYDHVRKYIRRFSSGGYDMKDGEDEDVFTLRSIGQDYFMKGKEIKNDPNITINLRNHECISVDWFKKVDFMKSEAMMINNIISPILLREHVDITECLSFLSEPEVVISKSPTSSVSSKKRKKCSDTKECECDEIYFKKDEVLKLPELLIIHLDRFIYQERDRKIETNVSFPIDNFEVSNFLVSNKIKKYHSRRSEKDDIKVKSEDEKYVYDLVGVIHHKFEEEIKEEEERKKKVMFPFIRSHKGSYFSVTKNQSSGRWYREYRNEITINELRKLNKSKTPYVLFYRKRMSRDDTKNVLFEYKSSKLEKLIPSEVLEESKKIRNYLGDTNPTSTDQTRIKNTFFDSFGRNRSEKNILLDPFHIIDTVDDTSNTLDQEKKKKEMKKEEEEDDEDVRKFQYDTKNEKCRTEEEHKEEEERIRSRMMKRISSEMKETYKQKREEMELSFQKTKILMTEEHDLVHKEMTRIIEMKRLELEELQIQCDLLRRHKEGLKKEQIEHHQDEENGRDEDDQESSDVESSEEDECLLDDMDDFPKKKKEEEDED